MHYIRFKLLNMKKVLLMMGIAGLAIGCKKKPETGATPTTPPATTYYFIKNWKADTLKNGLVGNNPTDSFYAFKHGDTSGIIYHGTTLYVFSKDGNDTTKATYQPIYIATTAMDTSTSWSTGWAFPFKYFHTGDNVVKYQKQAIMISNRAPHFATTGDASYYGK